MASFTDLPVVLQDKIFHMKHRLEMKPILDDMVKLRNTSDDIWNSLCSSNANRNLEIDTNVLVCIWFDQLLRFGYKQGPLFASVGNTQTFGRFKWLDRQGHVRLHVYDNTEAKYGRMTEFDELTVKEMRTLCKANNLRGGKTRKDLIKKLLSI